MSWRKSSEEPQQHEKMCYAVSVRFHFASTEAPLSSHASLRRQRKWNQLLIRDHKASAHRRNPTECRHLPVTIQQVHMDVVSVNVGTSLSILPNRPMGIRANEIKSQ